MKILSVFFLVVFLHANASIAEEKSIKIKESDWVGQSELNVIQNKASDSRFMLLKVIGKKDNNDLISYKGFFTPFPPHLDYYYAYWGMSNEYYQARKTALGNAGFMEIWHQIFLDASQSEVHQAVWQRLIGSASESKPAPENGSRDPNTNKVDMQPKKTI